MPNTVSLPFCVPWFAGSQGYAAPGLAMASHPTAYNGYLNQTTTLGCHKHFLNSGTSPGIFIPRADLGAFDCLEKYSVSSKFGYPYYKELIKAMLNEDFYIYFSGVDDFYLPGKSWYGTRHMSHDGVICGYNENDGTYSIAAYDINWVFNLIRVPQNCFIEGVKACLEIKKIGGLTAYKVKEGTTVCLNEPMILRYLNEYINQTADEFSLDPNGVVEGIAVQDFLAMYIDKLKDGSIPLDRMDWRVLRPVWEHKRCMLDRIRAIEQQNQWNDQLSEAYRLLVQSSDRARMMYAMYHKNQNESLLDKIKYNLLNGKEKEYEILKKLIDRMQEEDK